VRLPSGAQRLVRGSIIDVTEQRRLEEHMREGRKMDALGRMAAGIAHDFNNVLTVVNSSALMILEALDERSKVHSDVQAIVDAAQRGSAMVAQLLTFARQDDTPATRLDMNDVIRDVLRFAARVIDGRITLVQQLDPKGAYVCLDRTQLEQIIINLVLNARDAIQGALGAITITTRSRASTCTLRIADSGVGMTDEVRRRVFEPFFTTKASWGGTGLGLATVYSIVTRAGGSIVVDSAVGAGTAFEITLQNTSGSRE
jgi:C4-dicarboxylate-specific signal transduction histidine kinase